MRIAATVFLLLSLVGAPSAAHAQVNELEALNKEVISLYQKGQYDRAVVVARKALAVAEKTLGPHHLSVAKSLNNLGVLYAVQGQYAQAEPPYNRALAIREKALGPDHPDVAMSGVEQREVVQVSRHVGMIRTQRL